MAGYLNSFSLTDIQAALLRAETALEALRGRSLLLTGGTGFFGQWLLSSLIHANRSQNLGLEITVLTRSPDRFHERSPDLAKDPSVRLIAGEVSTFVLSRPRFTHIIHAATDTSLEADADPVRLLHTIVEGTRHVLDVAREAGALDLLYISSGAVYGGQGNIERVPETNRGSPDLLDRRSVYAEAKRLAETLCTIYRAEHDLRPRIARCFAFVGPGLPLDGHFAIGNFIRDALAGRAIEVMGDGTPIRSYLYAGDLVAWLLRALVLGKPGQAYNVGSDKGLSIREIAETVAVAIPTAAGVKVLGSAHPDGFRSRYVPSIDLARADLGVDVWTPLLHGVRETAAWSLR